MQWISAGPARWDKKCNIVICCPSNLDAMSVMCVKLCTVGVLFALWQFILVSLALTLVQGHSGITQLILCIFDTGTSSHSVIFNVCSFAIDMNKTSHVMYLSLWHNWNNWQVPCWHKNWSNVFLIFLLAIATFPDGNLLCIQVLVTVSKFQFYSSVRKKKLKMVFSWSNTHERFNRMQF